MTKRENTNKGRIDEKERNVEKKIIDRKRNNGRNYKKSETTRREVVKIILKFTEKKKIKERQSILEK